MSDKTIKNNSYLFFLKQLKKYQKYEVLAADKICILNDVNIINYNEDNKYDFLTSDNLKYEVKADEYSSKSGNFFIEFYGYNKPSGITTTEANYYIITDTINYYMIDVDKLKILCTGDNIKKTKDSSTFGHIISIEIIISNSIII